ncbi:probable inactive receptor kinase At4g23740 [Punica granatum]|uniref:Probable inactive receptor kinase At4g23740 n=1 Tax=Punica granatum TaxID=22663 RepID=A0A6P8EME5_PUNGR|nr:probable inactive receptor kinase At4g23740 [Punica granatum]
MGRTRGKNLLLIISAILFLSRELAFPPVLADLDEDKRALLDFLLGTRHARALNWRQDTPVCEAWTGVTCSDDRSRVVSLRLPGRGLRGPIPPNTLTRLFSIQVLSLRFNFLSGPLPSDFSVWENLTVLDLSNNGFSGSIPDSISKLTHIAALNLANNSLSGEIPDLNLPNLKWISLANNKLNGTMPKSLQRFPSWAFLGNNLALEASDSDHRIKIEELGEPALLGIALGACAVGFAVTSLLVITCCSSNGVDYETSLDSKGGSSGKKPIKQNPTRDDKIMSFAGFSYSLRFKHLLKLPAEVLGKGTFGHTYKAVLKDGNEVAIKWVAELSVAAAKFELLMETVGTLRHENIAPLRAYYCSRDEKMLVYDYFSEGSVSSILHGKIAGRQSRLSWERRVKIAVGAARGLAYIHAHNGKRLVHGNLKASNIFLNTQGFGCVSDIGLTTLMNPMMPASLRAAGYRAPEMLDAQNACQESDVYSFGVLLLELLTGKSPTHAAKVHLVRWVQSVVREEWSAEVFDLELLRCPNIEDEMIGMLKIGLACVATTPEERPKMAEVLEMVETVYQAKSKDQPSVDQKSPFHFPQA